MSKYPLLLLPLLVVLVGCGPRLVWVKSGATQSEHVQVDAACRLEASQQVPPDYSYSVSAGQSYQTERCDKKNRCTVEEHFVPPSYNRTDSNQDLRHDVARACMYRHGWSEMLVEQD